jgi:hypothetical protein
MKPRAFIRAFQNGQLLAKCEVLQGEIADLFEAVIYGPAKFS